MLYHFNLGMRERVASGCLGGVFFDRVSCNSFSLPKRGLLDLPPPLLSLPGSLDVVVSVFMAYLDFSGICLKSMIG